MRRLPRRYTYLLLLLPTALTGCGGSGYSDFSIIFGLGQESQVNIPPGKSTTLLLAIGFVERDPGNITITFQDLPYGVTASPNEIIRGPSPGNLPGIELSAGPGMQPNSTPTKALIVRRLVPKFIR
jgi:hypothetical protein